jgi:prepilin-type N-terminal cleavage/methylation domain-containing protein
MRRFIEPGLGRPRRAGVTLVELLVVVALIALLLGLMLPAVQSAREGGRRIQCLANLRQLALASLSHEGVHRALPTGGWGGGWSGDPDRGFGTRQPGGWAFNILPQLEQARLREAGTGLTDPEAKADQALVRLTTPLAIFACPTRRPAATWPLSPMKPALRLVAVPATVARHPAAVVRGDYAANMGSGTFPINRYRSGGSPATVAEGDSLTESAWQAAYGPPTDGLVFRRSRVRLKDIADGTTATYLLGEKYVDPAKLATGLSDDDDQCLYSGHDRDGLRVGLGPPVQDRPGFEPISISFGSGHADGCGMATADGSVTVVDYAIDPLVHRARASRNDGAR